MHKQLIHHLFFLFGALAVVGCVEPKYRNEVTSTGEGSVEIRRVPKDPTTDAPATPAESTQSDIARHVTMEDRIHALESQLHEKDAEIEQLKQQSHTAPATAPANH